MQLILLRHEQRSSSDPTFLSPLTEEGQRNAESTLPAKLLGLSITHIYTSPFLRCKQTLLPFCTQQQQLMVAKVRQEFAQYERIRASEGFEQSTYRQSESEIDHLLDAGYVPRMSLDAIKFNETEADVRERVRKFCAQLAETHSDDDVVLVVSHLSVINAFLERDGDDDSLPMGGLVHTRLRAGEAVPAAHDPAHAPDTAAASDERFFKSVLSVIGKASVCLLSMVYACAKRVITEPVYRTLCRWHVYGKSASSVVCTSLDRDLHACRESTAELAKTLEQSFPGVYDDETTKLA